MLLASNKDGHCPGNGPEVQTGARDCFLPVRRHTVPIGTLHMPLKKLQEKGIFVMKGTDSVMDRRSPYGLGDMLEKAKLYAQLYVRPNVLPLHDKGERSWPEAWHDPRFALLTWRFFWRSA